MKRTLKFVTIFSILLTLVFAKLWLNASEETQHCRINLAVEQFNAQENNSHLETVVTGEHPTYCRIYCRKGDCRCSCHSSKIGQKSGKTCTCTHTHK